MGYYLKKNGFEIRIIEKEKRVGGKICSLSTDYGVLELGPNALFLNADARELLAELNLSPVPAAPNLKRYIWAKNHPRSPLSFKLILTLFLRSYQRPPLLADGLSVADFFRPLLGEDHLKDLLDPIFAGVYATPVQQLHFKSVFPDLAERAHFRTYFHFFYFYFLKMKSERPQKHELKGSVSFHDGLQTLITRLESELEPFIELKKHTHLEKDKNFIICTDAHTAAELIKPISVDAAAELNQVKYQTLTSTCIVSSKKIEALDNAFGVLIPYQEKLNAIGILNNSAIFPHLIKEGYSYTFISPGQNDLKESIEDFKTFEPDFNSMNILFSRTTPWKKALPIYNLNRYISMKKLNVILKTHPGIVIFGNYVGGLSLREMISQAKLFAQEFKIHS